MDKNYYVKAQLISYKTSEDGEWVEDEVLFERSSFAPNKKVALEIFDMYKNMYYAGKFGFGTIARSDDELEFLVQLDDNKEFTIDFQKLS